MGNLEIDKLPEPENKKGYSEYELMNICKLYKLDYSTFKETLGTCSCIINNNEILTYKNDVLRVLNLMLNNRYLYWN